MLFLLMFLKLFFFISNVAALGLIVKPHAFTGQPLLVSWAWEPTDNPQPFTFDLRFVQPGVGDTGLALANIKASPSTLSGTAKILFNSPGPYQLVAVTGPKNTNIGQSVLVNVDAPPVLPSASPTSTSVSPTLTSQIVPCATMTVPSTALACGPLHKPNLGAIIGGTLGGATFLGLVAALAIMVVRRHQQRPENHRWTFYRDRLIRPVDLNVNAASSPTIECSSPTDVERGLSGDTSQGILYDMSSLGSMIASPSGSRPFIRSFQERPLPPAPLTSRQEMILERMDQVKKQMNALEKNPRPAQRIMLDDMQMQMSWLQDQLVAPWAMGLTDVTPYGFGHNMST